MRKLITNQTHKALYKNLLFSNKAEKKNVLLFEFYKVTRPFGLWDSIRNQLPSDTLASINKENRRDIIATFFAVPWQVVLFLTGMMVVLKQWSNAMNLFGLLVILSAGLYWFWFRHLSEEVKV